MVFLHRYLLRKHHTARQRAYFSFHRLRRHPLARALRVVPAGRLWVNPDCGLKTRTYDEAEASLTHLVAAAHRIRATLATTDD